MANYNFRKDLPVAKETEKEVAKLLEEHYGVNILSFGDTGAYDILALIKGKEIKLEVKEDFMCGDTGNVALEFGCRGKPSGIETTEADFYIYKLHMSNSCIHYVMQSTKLIREKIACSQYLRKVKGGDKGSNSMNYLFKYNVFIKGASMLPLDKI